MAGKPRKPARWAEIKAWLLDELTDDERLFVARWIGKFVNRWDQVPIRVLAPGLQGMREAAGMADEPSGHSLEDNR